jgi:hypothetical protein
MLFLYTLHLTLLTALKKGDSMKKNMGSLDRTIRIIVAVVIGILLFKGILSGLLATILGILAIIFLLTSAIGFCPIYKLIGVSTCCCSECKAENKEQPKS